MMDRLDELAAFVAIIDGGNLAAAARALRCSPPMITRALASLEARTGLRLIARTTRRAAPTEAGLRLAGEARRLLAGYDEALREPTAGAVRGTVRVTAPLVFGRRHVVPLVASFLDAYAEVRVEVVLHDRNFNLIEERLDVAVRIGPQREAELTIRRVGEVRRILVASPDYLAARGVPRAVSELANHDVIYNPTGRPGAPRWRFGGDADRRVVTIAPRLVVNDVEALLVAARAGRGIARPLSYQVEDELARRALVRILPGSEPPPLPVQLVTVHARQRTARVQAFLSHAARALSGLAILHEP